MDEHEQITMLAAVELRQIYNAREGRDYLSLVSPKFDVDYVFEVNQEFPNHFPLPEEMVKLPEFKQQMIFWGVNLVRRDTMWVFTDQEEQKIRWRECYVCGCSTMHEVVFKGVWDIPLCSYCQENSDRLVKCYVCGMYIDQEDNAANWDAPRSRAICPGCLKNPYRPKWYDE